MYLTRVKRNSRQERVMRDRIIADLKGSAHLTNILIGRRAGLHEFPTAAKAAKYRIIVLGYRPFERAYGVGQSR
jgi:hypothetical protein